MTLTTYWTTNTPLNHYTPTHNTTYTPALWAIALIALLNTLFFIDAPTNDYHPVYTRPQRLLARQKNLRPRLRLPRPPLPLHTRRDIPTIPTRALRVRVEQKNLRHCFRALPCSSTRRSTAPRGGEPAILAVAVRGDCCVCY